MNAPPLALCLVSAVAILVACPSSPGPDAGADAGALDADAGPDAGIDAGAADVGGCAAPGYTCDPVALPCCNPTAYQCDPVQVVCLPSGGSSSGGSSGSSGGLPNDGAQWVEEGVDAGTAGLGGIALPSASLQLAVGAGNGLGQILLRSPDGGWAILAGTPPATALYGIWADPAGHVFAVGQKDGGRPLWIAGSLDGGLNEVNLGALGLDGGPTSLDSVLGLGSGEAIAVGSGTFSTPAAAIHLFPDGGLAIEGLPPEVGKVNRLAGGVDGGTVFALATSSNSHLVWVLERGGGTWTAHVVFGAGAIADLAVGAAGDVLVAGDDGNGNGLVFRLVDGGYFPVAGLPKVPPLTAVCEPQAGELYLAASAPNQPIVLLHVDGGLSTGIWWNEALPTDAETVSAIAGDGAGNFFAVGVRACANCPGYPMALRRVP